MRGEPRDPQYMPSGVMCIPEGLPIIKRYDLFTGITEEEARGRYRNDLREGKI